MIIGHHSHPSFAGEENAQRGLATLTKSHRWKVGEQDKVRQGAGCKAGAVGFSTILV